MPGANTLEKQNPLLKLPAARRICSMPEEFRREWKQLRLELKAQAAKKANGNWNKRKYMNTAYWKVVPVYAGHAARLGNASAARVEGE